MKFIKNLMLGAFAAALAVSCSSDPKDGPNPGTDPDNSGDGFYMGLTIKMPGDGSKSSTTNGGQSSNGNEVGTDQENYVNNVLIVLAKATDNSFIVYGEVANNKLVGDKETNSYNTTAKLTKTSLNDYYKKSTERDVNVFVFCNPTTDLLASVKAAKLGDKTWYDLTCTVKEGEGITSENTSIWADNSFLMSNYSIATRTLPATMEDWNNYKTENTAFNLSGLNAGGQANEVNNSGAIGRGAIPVQRAAARFDFKDGSQLGNNLYDVVETKDADGTIRTMVQIQLGSMAITNMANQFYYLPRVSDNGQLSGSTLCGSETNTNYVVGPYAAVFNSSLTSNFSTYFNYPFFNNSGKEDNSKWVATSIANVLSGGKPDNWGKNEYKRWRYATENVIPGEPSNQKLGVSTVIVFKGKMIPSEWAKSEAAGESINNLAAALENATGNPSADPILYSFNGTLYLTWPEVQKAAIAASVQMKNGVPELVNGKLVINRADPLYRAVYGNGGIGKFIWGTTEYNDDKAVDSESANAAWVKWNDAGKPVDELLGTMRAKVTAAKFTIYQSSNDSLQGDGYYCYYYYKNRHNDNGQEGVMGPMEFSVVRNNVYKLAVTKISKLGHPRTPENDPDKPKPEEPDESDDIYLTVTCRVLPWVVRVNNIIF